MNAVNCSSRHWNRMRTTLGPNHLETLKVQWHLCVVLGVRDWRRSDQLADATLQALRDIVGADHPETLFVESQVAQRKNDESLKRFQEMLTAFERIYGPVHPMTLYAHREVIERWAGAGDVEKALEINRALLETLQRELGKHSPRLFELTHQRIDLLEQKDAKAQSVAPAESLLQTSQRVSGPQHPHTLQATETLGDVLRSNGEQERSIQVHQEAANLARQLYGPTSFEAGRLMLNVGYGHLQLNRYEEAEECYRQASSILRDAVGEKHWSTLNAQYHVAICLRKRGEFDAATTLLEQSLAIADREHGTDSHVSIQYARALANCFEDQDRGEEAGVWRQRTGEEFYRSEEWDGAAANLRRAARHHVEPTRKASALFWLSMAYWQSEQWQNARQAFDAARELTKTAPNNEELKKLQERADTLIGKTAAERRIARLSQEIEQKPGEFRLWRSRARLFAVEGRWNEAAADWAKWIELSEDKRSWSSPLKSACRELAGWPEIFVRLVDTLPDESTLWLASGQYHALRSQWAAAASDYARAFQSRPLNDRSICEYAGVLLLTGDTDGYQANLCANRRSGERATRREDCIRHGTHMRYWSG